MRFLPFTLCFLCLLAYPAACIPIVQNPNAEVLSGDSSFVEQEVSVDAVSKEQAPESIAQPEPTPPEKQVSVDAISKEQAPESIAQPEPTPPEKQCTMCGGKCVSLLQDGMNCGKCNVKCTSGHCYQGKCVCSPKANQCESHQYCYDSTCQCSKPHTFCIGSACVDLKIHPENCGKCGIKCKSGVCVNQHCSCTLDSDCTTGLTCQSGICNCPNGTTECLPLACNDLKTDLRNCGSCYNNCLKAANEDPKNVKCIDGQCHYTKCTYGYYLDKSGAVPTCRPFNAKNCNGKVCKPGEGCFHHITTGYICSCDPYNPHTQTPRRLACNGVCVPIESDPKNCSGCGNVCPPNAYCGLGVCHCSTKHYCLKPNPQLPFTEVVCLNDFMTNDDHCGKCFNQCASSQKCVSGTCQ